MTKHLLLSVLVFLCGIAVNFAQASEGNSPSAPRQNRPNIVVILADDLGWADLGCYGNPFHKTPHLDQLARDGIRCTQAYAACPVCSPTRAALLTGQNPARLHLTDWLPGRGNRNDQALRVPEIRNSLPQGITTLPGVLQSQGYQTCSIGKWHLGGGAAGPFQHGFQEQIAGDERGSPARWFAPFGPKAAANGEKNQQGKPIPGLEGVPDGVYLTDALADKAVAFIEKQTDEKPFFLYLPHFAVHTPMNAPEETIQKFRDNKPPGVVRNEIYAAMLYHLDAAVGKVMNSLTEKGFSKNTIVVFTSDNGGLATIEGKNTPATINAPLREGKGWLYEGGIRVPLIVSFPKHIPDGSTTDVPMTTLDLFPSLLSLAGIQDQVDANSPLDGMNVSDIWRGNATPELKKATFERPLYWHYPHYANQGGFPGGVIRQGPWKYIENYQTGRKELFLVDKDPGEGRNRAPDEPEKITQFAAQLSAWKQSVNAQETVPNPDYIPNPPHAKTGVISIPAKSAQVYGRQLRYEPLPHKQTVGFWVEKDDYVVFPLTVTKPGNYRLRVFQGCGKGSGGAIVEAKIEDSSLTFVVEETGHFQNFVWRDVGELKIDDIGRQEISLKAVSKPGVAVGDFRALELIPQ
ncbi:Arylsulfatase [Planctopirus ephydatiae]|uniref:Arylsulfatase n=1 Tax=Planctopirus ephydatiae TaxID=2528019 RepID=A0A518GP71_9PLAN|nr:sulfatase [Planctopirus ephydatiae]QDV30397.1 Arylsulfatase [Planctopirus ephydatiae]